ncbi:MAG: SDR family NAD(P)-dependent oxidoreductase [Pirellulales bacterium]|nr:SDR family NAD(P)-dependent oxidoreductase [Pirellulales bacterium]
MKTVLITGVSSGIGLGLAREYAARGWRVFGISRRVPSELDGKVNVKLVGHDLAEHANTPGVIEGLLDGVDSLDLAILNAGILGTFGDLVDAPLEELKRVADVNLWANKVIIDALFEAVPSVRQVVTISSGASVSGNRGWAGYGISKAALNMLTALYAAEKPKTHFAALAPGIVDTAMQDEICARPVDERYQTVEVLRGHRGTPMMPTPDEAAKKLIAAIEQLPDLVPSGAFADIRKPPLAGSI